MQRCLQLAEKGKGNVAPNPMVGAVLVHEGRIIGEGWHRQYGEAHAEVNCINNVREEDQHLIAESTMYVSLEPCAHHGKTPPCALRIIDEKIKKVVVCNDDPFEKVDGEGIQLLKEKGVKVEQYVLDKAGKWQNRRFFTFHHFKRPYIILKWAETNDGFIAPEDRSRFQITNKDANTLVHQWRTEEAAIIVGFTTALNDNPQLTARYATGKQPLRMVLDRKLQLPLTHHLFDGSVATWVINEMKEEQANAVYYKRLNFDDTLLSSLLKLFYEANIQSLIVEGGTVLLDSFIKEGLWDEARVFTGDVSLGKGIAAPQLYKGGCIFSTNIADDILNVYLNESASFNYTNGLPL